MTKKTGKSGKKSLYRHETHIFAGLLRDTRLRAELSQMELVEALDMTQTFASDAERGSRRLDIVQIRDWCILCGTTLPAFIAEFEERLVDQAYAKRRETDGRKRSAGKK
jgi:transcriptional regulator with XRE-family HTH domain